MKSRRAFRARCTRNLVVVFALSFYPFLRNALRLNTASHLHAVHDHVSFPLFRFPPTWTLSLFLCSRTAPFPLLSRSPPCLSKLSRFPYHRHCLVCVLRLHSYKPATYISYNSTRIYSTPKLLSETSALCSLQSTLSERHIDTLERTKSLAICSFPSKPSIKLCLYVHCSKQNRRGLAQDHVRQDKPGYKHADTRTHMHLHQSVGICLHKDSYSYINF